MIRWLAVWIVLGSLWRIDDRCCAAETIDLVGLTHARRTIVLSSAIPGRIKTLHVRMGDRVKRGQVLVELDDEAARLAVELARVQAAATGDLELARIDVELQTERHRMLTELALDQMAHPEEIRRVLGLLRQGQARLRIATEQQSLRAGELKQAEFQLRRHQITSPLDGVVGNLLHDIGETLMPGDMAVAELLETSQLDARFDVEPWQLQLILSMPSCRIHLLGSDTWVDARLDRVSPALDPKSGTMPLYLRFDNPQNLHRAGDDCRLTLRTRSEDRDRSDRDRNPAVWEPADAALEAGDLPPPPVTRDLVPDDHEDWQRWESLPGPTIEPPPPAGIELGSAINRPTPSATTVTVQPPAPSAIRLIRPVRMRLSVDTAVATSPDHTGERGR